MEKENIIITIEVTLPAKDKFEPHYLDAQRKIMVSTTRAMLFRSLDAIEKKLTRIYPPNEIPHEQGNTPNN